MRQVLEGERDLFEEREPEQPRDVVLGTSTLLGVFLAVSLVCAVCFGFGYSRGHGVPPASVAKERPEPRPLGGFGGLEKPAPGMAALQAAAPAQQIPSEKDIAPGELPGMPPNAEEPDVPHERAPVVRHVPLVPSPAAPSVPVSALAQQAAPAVMLMVQIAAVSHAADANTLAEALRHDGFRAVVRTSTADPLFHVQIGPFPSLDAAKAMRTRLVDSGYNAFIKP